MDYRMNTRNLPAAGIYPLLFFLLIGCSPASKSESPGQTPSAAPPLLHIHFLGHAAFILEFDNGLSVLSDYGDASETGWPVRVFDPGGFRPDIVTYSQPQHPDHYRETDFPGAITLLGDGNIIEYGLSIDPVPTHALSMDSVDSYGFLFTYKGAKILLAGDPLQYILNAHTVEVQKEIRETYADVYDLAVVPVSGSGITFPQLEFFIRLLKAKRVILMHAMSESLYPAFLEFLEKEHPGRYQVENRKGPGYDLDPSVAPAPPIVIALKPAAYTGRP
jgi:L-ascorbate metabolism protein UlaG (beta-lactamase superfamily)